MRGAFRARLGRLFVERGGGLEYSRSRNHTSAQAWKKFFASIVFRAP